MLMKCALNLRYRVPNICHVRGTEGRKFGDSNMILFSHLLHDRGFREQNWVDGLLLYEDK